MAETQALTRTELTATINERHRPGQPAHGTEPRSDGAEDRRDARYADDAAFGDRRGSEKHYRVVEPGCGVAGHSGQPAGARRLRRGATQRHRQQRAAAFGLQLPDDARQRHARRLPDPAAQSAGTDRHRREVSARRLSRIAQRKGRRGTHNRRAAISRRPQQACRRDRREIHRARRDGRIGADVFAVGSGLCRAPRQLSPTC